MIFASNHWFRGVLWTAFLLYCGSVTLYGADWRRLAVPLPPSLSRLSPVGRPAATNELRLTLVLPLRDRPGLETLVAEISDPSSPDFRQFLSPQVITARFGPTAADYAAVAVFARSHQLAITARHQNRLVLEVSGPVAAIENAFHITLRTYRHPTETRDFFAPDTTPMVAAALPVVGVEGLSDYSRPHPRWHQFKTPPGHLKIGSAPDGSGGLIGNDFRNAYIPGTALTGAGQSVGLFEWDGSYSNAVAAYARAAGGGRTNIAIKYVLLGGFNGTPTRIGEGEVELDIEMAMAMAPGLSSIVVFEGNPSVKSPLAILNTMAASNSIKNLSCSWGWSASDASYTNTDAVFLEMAAQGQTFFNASGDSEAFTTGANSVNGMDNPSAVNAPSSSPYITQVGGTTLALIGAGQSWQSEVVWNWGTYGSSGGISSYYAIPAWQTNASNLAARGGSTKFRNTPDVAANADNIYEVLGNPAGVADGVGGTSAAAPLWAGFMALVNQQLAAQGHASAGFINPTLYALAAGAAYPFCYHDVTHGSNIWTASPKLFFAGSNYDLCTGIGTMNGTNLINALAPPAPVLLAPVAHAGSLPLNWRTVAGAAYQVQTTPNLKSATWTNWGAAITTTGTLATVTDTITNSQRFYRVVVRP